MAKRENPCVSASANGRTLGLGTTAILAVSEGSLFDCRNAPELRAEEVNLGDAQLIQLTARRRERQLAFVYICFASHRGW
jgi:hypothetical protein